MLANVGKCWQLFPGSSGGNASAAWARSRWDEHPQWARTAPTSSQVPISGPDPDIPSFVGSKDRRNSPRWVTIRSNLSLLDYLLAWLTYIHFIQPVRLCWDNFELFQKQVATVPDPPWGQKDPPKGPESWKGLGYQLGFVIGKNHETWNEVKSSKTSLVNICWKYCFLIQKMFFPSSISLHSYGQSSAW